MDTSPCPLTKAVPEYIKEGGVYVVSDVGICCMVKVALKEYPVSRTEMRPCLKCRTPIFGYYAWRFTKLTGDDVVVDDAVPTEDQLDLEEFIRKEAEKLV